MTVPVALFAYARTDCLEATLRALRADGVPLIHAFSDGPRTPELAPGVAAVRALLRSIDWAEVRLVERPANLGLGASIRAGVEAVLAEHEAVIVFEDDLVCAPGTYAWFCRALERYRDAPAVLSVTGFAHPRVVPAGVDGPYFDGRTDSWSWATWRRAWRGMDRPATSHLADAVARGIDPERYGADLPVHARIELERNIWAVRWVYLHIAQGGLCLRPPRSLVRHIGTDWRATNACGDHSWDLPTLGPPPPPECAWPEPVEHPACAALWRGAYPRCSWPRRMLAAALGPALRYLVRCRAAAERRVP